jgi:hypothetical protein
MGIYRLYCMDGDGRIATADWIEASSDDEAIVLARSKKLSVACELWDRDRLVASLSPRPIDRRMTTPASERPMNHL